MINRNNYHLVLKHLEYRRSVIQNDQGMLSTYWQSLKHLLQWSDATGFEKAHKIIPAFPEYLLTARNDGKETPLTPKYMVKVLSHARAFFEWLRLYERGFSGLSEAWIRTMIVRRSAGVHTRLTERQYYRLEEIKKIAAVEPENLRERRDRAAICFLFMSGIRVGAFVTLPVECVDIDRLRVKQLPEMGVHTKNTKAAVTFLIPMDDELMKVVRDWDDFIRAEEVHNWYPAISTGDAITHKLTKDRFTRSTRIRYQGRTDTIAKGLKALCEKAGVSYKSPHKLRHGFGVFGVRNAQNIEELKAISQNLMHANLGITDGIYGNLAEDDLSEILLKFGKNKTNTTS